MKFDLESYEPVDERIQKFYADHPDGRIMTALVSDPNALDEVLFSAAVYHDAGETIRATGYASERRGSGGANQTSHVENAETSAIGRALANAGYKAKRDAPRPCREEMQKANGGSVPVGPSANPVWHGPGQCPTCRAPEGKQHGTKCTGTLIDAPRPVGGPAH